MIPGSAHEGATNFARDCAYLHGEQEKEQHNEMREVAHVFKIR